MDDDADAAREYERLRAELAEFVLGVLTERLAAGEEPRLSQALIDAIDRRVEDAVAARLGNGASAVEDRPSRPTRRPPPRESWFTRGRIVMLAIAGLAIAAAIVFFVVRMLPGTTTTAPRTPATNDAVFNVQNGQITPVAENGAAPANAAGENPPIPQQP